MSPVKKPQENKKPQMKPNDNMQRKENEKAWDFSIHIIWKENKEK